MIKTQPFLPTRPLRFLQPAAFCLAFLPLLLNSGPAFAEDAYRLESVDFRSTADRTKIILHTGSIVPVRQVLVSDAKLVLDIDRVTADDTVKTDFSGTGNISHVILQPLNEHQIRMIVRGERLGSPSIAFYGGDGVYSETNPAFTGQAQGAAIAPSGVVPTERKPLAHPPTTPDMIDARSIPAETPIAFHDEPAASKQPETPLPAEKAVTSAPAAKPVAESKQAQTDGEMLPLTLPSDLEGSSEASGKQPVESGYPYQTYLLYGAPALLLLGLAGFIRHKLGRLRQNLPAEEYPALPDGSASSAFREMAEAYRDQQQKAHPTESRPPFRGGKSQSDRMIGLGALSRMEAIDTNEALGLAPQAETRRVSPEASLERILTTMQSASIAPKKAPAPAAPKKQAVNRYLQSGQAVPTTAPAMQTGNESEEERIREVLRAQSARQEVASRAATPSVTGRQEKKSAPPPVGRPLEQQAANNRPAIRTPNFQSVSPDGAIRNKAKAARPKQPFLPSAPLNQATSGQPLPGNPEVLNFLRNVAELMEKDGKTEIARSIQRNLKP